MRRVLYLLPVMTLLFAVSGFAQLTAATGPDNAPKVGDMAPDFQVSAGGRGAQPMNLKDFVGKKRVLMMFFPGAFTPGCTQEFTEAGQFYEKIAALNIQMLGISAGRTSGGHSPHLNLAKVFVGEEPEPVQSIASILGCTAVG